MKGVCHIKRNNSAHLGEERFIKMMIGDIEKFRIKGFIVGENFDGDRTLCSINTDVEKVPKTIDSLRAFDDIGFPKIVGGLFYVYPYVDVDGLTFRAVDTIRVETIGTVDGQDLQSYMLKLMDLID